MTIGEKIADMRKQNKMTQRDLAEMINVSDKVISKWETGRSLPDVEAMMRLSKTFNVSVSELYECVEKTNTQNAEDYNEERIWQYKKYSIISYACYLTIPSLTYYISTATFWHSQAVKDSIHTFYSLACIILFILANVFEITQFIRLFSFNRQKFFRSKYNEVLLKYGLIFIAIAIFSICATFAVFKNGIVAY